jgi:hypothetical protein
MQEGGKEWCEYHGRLWERHRAAGYCMTLFPDRSWCSCPADKWQSKQRCNNCLEREISEAAAAKEAAAKDKTEREAEQRHQREQRVLEAQSWFSAFERYLNERFEEQRYKIEERVSENYVAKESDTYDWS